MAARVAVIGALALVASFAATWLWHTSKSERGVVLKTESETGMSEAWSVFADIRVNVNAPNACSPRQLDPHWEGILLRAPSRAMFASSAFAEGKRLVGTIPLCGYKMVNILKAKKSGPLVIVAQEIGTINEYRGTEQILDPSPTVPLPFDTELSDEELQGLSSGGPFNPNLLDFVELPARPAKYMVHFEQAGMRSNHVVIEIVASSK